MKALVESTAFRKDLKRTRKRGIDVTKLAAVLRKLQQGEPLPGSNRAHQLKGEWKAYWECHVEPDWLLIYKVTDDEVRLAPALAAGGVKGIVLSVTGRLHGEEAGAAPVTPFMTVRVCPFFLTVTLISSCTFMVSSLRVRS
jgi:mRNA interferase YafQ